MEYQVNWHTGRLGESSRSGSASEEGDVGEGGEGDDDDDDDDDELEPVYTSSDKLKRSDSTETNVSWEICTSSRAGQGGRGFVFLRGTSEVPAIRLPMCSVWSDVPR